jgi:predicted nucleotidyltransferase component of viral defense system
MDFAARQIIEIFQLVFLRALIAKGDDKALIALKGGCNLRFYFGSVRYSEDIDFDVVVMARDTLKNKVERLLRSPLVAAPLKTKGIEVSETSATKQTDTTQRWKVGLSAKSSSVPLRTKIEFSRRSAIDGEAFASVDPEVLRPYGLPPFLATHYTTRAAIVQKIQALAGRTEPQTRDVFDLNLLLARSDAAHLALTEAQKRQLPSAIEHAMGMSFDDYRSKVVAYLDPSHVALHEDASAWRTMQDAVVARLEALQ